MHAIHNGKSYADVFSALVKTKDLSEFFFFEKCKITAFYYFPTKVIYTMHHTNFEWALWMPEITTSKTGTLAAILRTFPLCIL